MREILQIAMEQLWKLTVLGPAWLLTPEGRKALLNRNMLRRVLMSVAFTLILVGLAQTLPFDLALIFAGDVLTYAEVAAIVWIASANGVLTQALRLATHAGLKVLRRLRPTVAGRAQQAAGRQRRPRRTAAPPADDEGAAAFGWALAA